MAVLLGMGCAQSEPKPENTLDKGSDTTTNIVAARGEEVTLSEKVYN